MWFGAGAVGVQTVEVAVVPRLGLVVPVPELVVVAGVLALLAPATAQHIAR